MKRPLSRAAMRLRAMLSRQGNRVERSRHVAARSFQFCLPLAACALAFASVGTASAQPSFPGAEGHGTTTPGGRGGPVLRVTTLADRGEGSLRWALETMSGPRIVVFAVGGEIALKDQISVKGNVTVAGQTAPGSGITITGGRLHVVGSDVILRGLRVRPGNGRGQSLNERDGISVGTETGTVRRVVVDHNSITWGVDENLATWYRVEDVTFSDNIVAEALYRAGHSEGAHSMGMLIGKQTLRVSILRNLFVSNYWRNPQIVNSLDTEVINNFVFNYGAGGLHVSQGPIRLDIINNVYEAGRDTPDANRREAIELVPKKNGDSYFLSGNLTETGQDDLRGSGSKKLADRRVTLGGAHTILPAADVKAQVLAHAGARAPELDRIDARIVRDTARGVARVINSPWPGGAADHPEGAIRPDTEDRDRDGLPDLAEAALGTRPDVVDSHLIDPASGYAYIELWANGLIR